MTFSDIHEVRGSIPPPPPSLRLPLISARRCGAAPAPPEAGAGRRGRGVAGHAATLPAPQHPAPAALAGPACTDDLPRHVAPADMTHGEQKTYTRANRGRHAHTAGGSA
jgi:hypothetical protein